MGLDSTTLSLDAIGDPSQYTLKRSVPWFRAHTLKKKDGSESTVTEDDLPEIAQHMQALEKEGRLFRLTQGHINLAGDEDEQPDLLAFARNARFDFFGPKRIPCVMVDEYARNDKLDTLRELPYRSAEYYPKKKLITGCGALIRDPELNLGAVLYSHDSEPWHYAEAFRVDDKEKEFSPEETAQMERMCHYMAKKFPKLFGPEAMGPANAAAPEPVKEEEKKKEEEKEPEQFRATETPEFYAMKQETASAKREAEAAKAEAAALRKERETEKCQLIVSELARHYRLDPDREVKALLPLNASGRDEHVAYIKANYSELPGGDPIDLYRGNATDFEPGRNPNGAPKGFEKTMAILRANPGMTYDQAEAKAAG